MHRTVIIRMKQRELFMARKHYVNILECKDGSLYTGYKTDITCRFKKHESGNGAQYTRGRGPLKLRDEVALDSKTTAMKREYMIKQVSPSKKWELIETYMKGGEQVAESIKL